MRASTVYPVIDLAPLLVGDTVASVVLPDTNKPLIGLAGTPLAGRFRHWCGLSGRRYLFSIFPLAPGRPLEDVPRYDEAVVLVVRRDLDGTRTILMAADTGTLPDMVFSGQSMRDAIAAGAEEIHMHLLANDASARRSIAEDFGG